MDNYTVPQLKKKWWTDALIKKFPGDADAERPNPRFRTGSPMRLYSIKRVNEIEQSQEFKEALALARKRREASKKVARERSARLAEDCLKDVSVQEIPIRDLRRLAIKSQKDRYISREDFGRDVGGADDATIERWMVNYARHNLSNYDSVRADYAGKVGVHEAAEAVRSAVLDKIAEIWPELERAANATRR